MLLEMKRIVVVGSNPTLPPVQLVWVGKHQGRIGLKLSNLEVNKSDLLMMLPV